MKNSAATSGMAPAHGQRGVALVFALMILLVLTLLSLSALRTSSLEQIMAGNTQELTRAFEAAESGLAMGLGDPSTFSSISSTATNTYVFEAMGAQATVETTYSQTTAAPRSSVPTGQGTADIAHFDQKSTAVTGTGARTIIHQGVKKNIPKPN